MDYPRRVAIIGGTGKVGRHIATKAVENGYQVRMLVRNPEKLASSDSQIEIVVGNVQNTEVLNKLLENCQIVVNTFGQPSKEKPIYSSVTESILNVMCDLQIERYICVTGGSLTVVGDQKSIINSIGAKVFKILYSNMLRDRNKEWEILNHNQLIKWTLIRLPFIVEGKEIGNIKENLTDMPGTKITNGDVASFIIDQIDNPNYIRKAPFISN